MTTRADLRRSLRQMLTDAAAWPDSQLDEWCRQAIYDYSLHFPYSRTASWEASAAPAAARYPARRSESFSFIWHPKV